MALRMTGIHLSTKGMFHEMDQREYQDIFGAERYWRPVLHIYGLSAVLQTLEVGTSSENYTNSLASLIDNDHSIRCQEATVKIRTWCRGLLEVFTVDQTDIMDTFDQSLHDTELSSPAVRFDGNAKSLFGQEPKFGFLKFTHRSIPDFLMSVIHDKAGEHNFNDDTIATGIVAMLVAETKSNYNDTEPLNRNLLYCYQHVLRLLRLRAIAESSLTFPMLDKLELARFHAYGRTHPDFLSECRDFTDRMDTLTGSQQNFSISWDDQRSRQSFHASALPWGATGTVLTPCHSCWST
ncbi:hypothetical protein BKA65DRAFT_560139 [Rhexocercosporidium sp. MPI-PUGE-AT-0058]|nr:hypothetical protein BKA65DRAFT_560139 [Rhexocercosporidium sp. MPI-PUGE-AT-0058]